MKPRSKTFIRTTGALAALIALSGCNAFSRLIDTGDKPQLSAIENPVDKPDYEEVTMPMPATVPPERNSSSLWRAGAKTFFKDNRATHVGDLITVLINISDSATTTNATTRTRTNSDSV
ncbi:MAG: flagellar basal body L-ring protein, partial [Rhodospirillaceae bacterium]|nr:flagellar basal body L-ring protein [Rhodospirillaceae bacterium]